MVQTAICVTLFAIAMIPFSAAEAITPAIDCTKQFLFKPFRLGRFLKLTLVAMLVEGGFSSFSSGSKLPSGNGGKAPFHIPPLHFPTTQFHWPAIMIVGVMIAAFLLIVVPIGLVIGYLLIRLRFSFFDCMLRRQDQIAVAWRRYHAQALRFLWMTVILAIAVWALLAVVGVALYQHFKPLFQALFSDSKPTLSDFLPMLAALIPLFVLLALAGGLLNIALGDFVLPRMALEDATVLDAVGDVWEDFQAEPGQFLLYVFLRFLLTLLATIIGVIGLVIPVLLLIGIGVGAVLLLKGLSLPVAILLGVPAAILLLFLAAAAFVGVAGTIGTFRRAYAMMFYAGRFSLMGEMLAPAAVPLPPWQGGLGTGPVSSS